MEHNKYVKYRAKINRMISIGKTNSVRKGESTNIQQSTFYKNL